MAIYVCFSCGCDIEMDEQPHELPAIGHHEDFLLCDECAEEEQTD